MRKLGISVYPEHAGLEENKKYIELAAKYGFSRIFTCLLSAEGDKEKIKQDFKDMILHAKKYNFEVIADVVPNIFHEFGISYGDLSFFHEMGVDGIRLDEGFSGNEESLMTFNPYNLMIELNASQVTGYLDNIISYHPDKHMLLGCHNFYPKKRSGLSRKQFIRGSEQFKKYGIRVAAFISSHSASFGPWPVSEGLCSLEEHRFLPVDVQAKDLFNTNLVDDVIIANCFASEEELKKLSEINKELMVLDVELETEISETEEKIAFEELHFFRGDVSEYTVRSTLPRVKYKEYEIKPNNTRSVKKGDVLIENSNYSRYKGELHIALKDFENEGNTNVIGRVSSSNFRFIDQIQPWQKFRLKKI